MRLRAAGLAAAAALLIAACKSTEAAFTPPNELANDPRCFKVAATPAWKITFSITVNDTGTAADSFRVAVHHHFVGTGTTSALSDYAPDLVNELQWNAVGATGTFQVHDTLTNLFTGQKQTLTGQGFADMAPVAWAEAGGSVVIDLDACTIDFGARPYGRIAHKLNGAAAGVDTLMVGEFEIIQLPFDSAHVKNGWTVPLTKYGTLAGYNWMPYGGQYLLYGFGDHYTGGASLDSSQVSITVTPVAHP